MVERTETLRQVCDLIVDCPHFTPEWTDSGYIVVRNQNIRDGSLDLSQPSYTHRQDFERRTKRAKPKAGDIIFTREAPMGEVCMVPDGIECCVGQRQVLLRPSTEIDGRYLFYSLRSPYVRHQILWNEGTGSTVSNVRIPILEALKIPRLGRTEKAIGQLLGSLDDKIELNRRMNETLEAMAQAIFRDWFVDFGPTRRKLDGATDPLTIMGGLVQDAERAQALADLFPATLGDDGLPEGWATTTLESYSSLNPESWSAKTAPDQVEYVDLANTKWGTIESTSVYSWEDAPSRARRIVRSGDTIVGTVRPGNGSYAFVGRDGLTASTGFAVLRPKQPAFNELVNCAATSPENIQRLEKLADGGAYPAVKPEVIVATPVPLVPGDVALDFSSFAAPIFEKIELSKDENRTLAATRDLLLPKLMSGEIRLSEAVDLMEAAQ